MLLARIKQFALEKQGLLELKQFLLAPDATAIAGERTIGPNHAVAWDDD